MKNLTYKPGHYLAFELSQESRAHLLSMHQTSFSKVICHHVTMEFNLTAQKLKEFQAAFSDDPKVRVVGFAKGDGIECAAVSIDGVKRRNDGSFYHVTMSLEPPHKPVESNKLSPNTMRGWIDLEGAFKLLPK